MSFQEVGLIDNLQQAVADQGYTEPTPVQQKSIPAILARSDLMVGAQTGTGKTAGFTLPMLQLLNEDFDPGKPRIIRALILVPTRELAAQVGESVRIYGKYLQLRSTTVFGGANMSKQIEKLARGVEILIATPGRLLDHVERKNVDLSRIEFLVLDEADRMLDMGFINDIRKVIRLIPKQRQNLLFSATYSNEIKSLADTLLNNPEMIQVESENSSAQNITHVVHPVDHSSKRQLLVEILNRHETAQVLLFMNMKHLASRLTERLNKSGFRAVAIHGDKTQAKRVSALRDFKSGKVRVLVATDLASRGLDIEDLPFVINYDLPMEAEVYVHRTGRTGRAGKTGIAISLVAPDEMGQLRDIEKLIGQELTREIVPGYEPDNRITRLYVPGQPLSQRA